MNNLKFLGAYLSRLFSRYRKNILTKVLWVLGILILLFLIFQVWKRNETSITCSVVSEGIIGIYNNSNLPNSVTSLLSEPLIILDKSGKPTNNLIESFKSSENNTIYSLTLKNNLYWGDNTKVKSSEIKINLPDVEVTYPDDLTINIKLADTFTPFLTLLTQPVLKSGTLTGLGKYNVTFEGSSHGYISKLVLEPRDKSKCQINPYIHIRFYPDEQTIKTAFKLGEIDVILALSDPVDLKSQPGILVKNIQNYSKLVAIFYNTKDPSLDKNFRKALNYSTNSVMQEDIAKTSISPASWAFNTDLKNVRGDLESAKASLNKVETGKDKLITLTATPIFASLGEKIIQDWKKTGINAVLRVESGVPQNFQALLTSVSIPHDPDQYALWHSTQDKTNISKYSNPRVDKDLEDGRKIDDAEKRKEKYFDFQKVLQDDVPATFLYFPKTNVVLRKKAEYNLNKIINIQLPQY